MFHFTAVRITAMRLNYIFDRKSTGNQYPVRGSLRKPEAELGPKRVNRASMGGNRHSTGASTYYRAGRSRPDALNGTCAARRWGWRVGSVDQRQSRHDVMPCLRQAEQIQS